MAETATTIDEVIEQLLEIIDTETREDSTLAFFPVLYLKVTRRIKEGILNNEFEDNARMEILDVLFANRYLLAYHQYKKQVAPTASWEKAFDASKNKKLLILQHLLLGINAHINLDLGIAVSETMGTTTDLQAIKHDFDTINSILASMVDEVQNRIGSVSPLFSLLEKVGKGKEDKVVSFSINMARDGAWVFANQYHHATDKASEVKLRDQLIANLATKLYITKSRWLRWVIRAIRWLEQKRVKKVVEVLGS